MNYRTMVKGALALSLSLTVGTAWAVTSTPRDVQTYGVTFEPLAGAATVENDHNYTNNMPIADATLHTGSGDAASGWLAAADDESKIVERIAEGSTQALQLNTDANTLTNKFASDVASGLNTAIAGNGAFFETEVKFVASDTLDAGITGAQDATKFAIYAYVNENVTPNTTNLVIFHRATIGEDTVYTNNAIEGITIDTEVYTKLRVEMKKLDFADYNEDPEAEPQYQNVFSVMVGDTVVTNALAYDDVDGVATTSANGKWFRTVERATNEDKQVSSLNFKGTGEIDNIKVGTVAIDTTYAIDWTGSANVVVSNATGEVTGTSGDFVDGTVLTFYATEGLITNANNVALDPAAASWTFTVAAADATFTVLAGIQATPLDDTWTIEGFNPAPSVWPLPAATSADSKTLFYSNVVDNIDDIDASQGRTIKAAWIGAKIIAPEAVTDETIANWKFDMAGAPGNAFSTSHDGKENGHYVMNLWVPLTAAKIRTAVNNRSDITYALDFYLDGGTTTQTLAMVISPKDIKLTNTDNVSDVEEIEVINWEIQNAGSDDYEAGNTVDGAQISAGMATWLNNLKSAKSMTKAELEAAFDSDGLSVYEEYLLNTDPTVATTVDFSISSIAVGATVDLQVTLTRTENNGAVTSAINGELKILGATSLDGQFDAGTAVDADFAGSDEGATSASKSLTTGNKFFKAVIVEKAAAPAGE